MKSILYCGYKYQCLGVDEFDYLVLNKHTPLEQGGFTLREGTTLDQEEDWEDFGSLRQYIGERVCWISKHDAELLEEKPLYGIYD